MNYRIGTGEAEILFPVDMLPTPKEQYEKVHDLPMVHAFYFAGAQQEPVNSGYVIFVLDLVNWSYFDELSIIAQRYTKVSKDHVMIHCGHVLSTPHLVRNPKSEAEEHYNLQYQKHVYEAAEQALRQAVKGLEPGMVAITTVDAPVNVNRVVKYQDVYWQGTNPQGETDSQVTMLVLANEKRELRGVLYSVNMAAGVLEGSLESDGKRSISADIAGYSERKLKEKFPDAVFAYGIGASGDQWQAKRSRQDRLQEDGTFKKIDLQEKGYNFVAMLGDILVGAMEKELTRRETKNLLQPLEILQPKRDIYVYTGQKPLGNNIGKMHPLDAIVYEEDGPMESDVQLLRINDTVLLGAHSEINVSTLHQIQEAVPAPLLFLEFTNGDGGYMPTQEFYDHHAMQSRKTKFFRGTAEKFATNMIISITKLFFLSFDCISQ